MIKSRTTNYLNARFPILKRVQEFFLLIVFIIWILGAILGFYLFSKEPSTDMLTWIIVWTLIGFVPFYLSFKWLIGTQRICVEQNELIISKKFLFIKLSKRINFNKINKLEIKPIERLNPFIESEIKTKNNLAWLRINNDNLFYLNSNLYPEDQLQQIINYWKSSFNLSSAKEITKPNI